jgi:tetratricopeptide (TPR) repeat protein
MTNYDKNFSSIWHVKKLMQAWKAIREGLKKADARDCLDYIEFDLFAEAKIKALRESIISGSYIPGHAGMFELAKGRGAFRTVSILSPEDSLVFRRLVDNIYLQAQKYEPEGVFYAQGQPTVPIGPHLISVANLEEDIYESAWKIWFIYNQYRTRTLLNKVLPILVTADITNFFESIQHELLIEYLAPLGLPRKAIGLLGKLLESFKPESGDSPTPRVGLPVDQHDCSRVLAHVFLFEHDRRIIDFVGKDHYVRWMDDQNIAVSNDTKARTIVRQLTISLSQQRLVLNSGKTRFLNMKQVNDLFHLEANENLDQVDILIKKSNGQNLENLRSELSNAWQQALVLQDKGNWDKVLKRFYAAAGRLKMPFLRTRALSDLIDSPLLAKRIFEYYSALNDFDGLLKLFEKFLLQKESLYESVETAFFENILLNNIPNNFRSSFKKFTINWLNNDKLGCGRPYSRGSAALCLYWLSDKRSVSSIRRVLIDNANNYPATTTRALVAAQVALAPEKIDDVLKICARLGNKELASFAQFVEVIRNDKDIDCTLPKIAYRKPYCTQVSLFEARTWLRLEILTLSKSQGIRKWLKTQDNIIKRHSLGDCELRAYTRWKQRL